MKHQQLTEGQRDQISVLRENNLSCHEPCFRIRSSKSTVSRELRRNTADSGYEPQKTQQMCNERRQSAGKRTIMQQTVEYVEFAQA